MNEALTEIAGEELTEQRNLTVRFSIEFNGKTTAQVNSLKEASELFRETIDELCVGASMVGDCIVSQGSRRIARISYNGRVWEL